MTEERFHKEYLSLADTLYRIAFYMLESEAEAEDAVQEVFLKLWDARAQLDAVQSPKAYSIRLLKNLCLNRIRKARQLRFQPELPEAETGLPQDDTLDARQRLDKVLEGIKSLPAAGDPHPAQFRGLLLCRDCPKDRDESSLCPRAAGTRP